MQESATTRRRFLAATLAFSGLATVGSVSIIFSPAVAWAAASGRAGGREALVRIARHLYPHKALDDSVYVDVVDSILESASSNSTLAQSLDSLIESLDKAHGSSWITAEPSLQVRLLADAESQPHFTAARIQVLTRLYNHPATWELIGYDGPSVQYGGYVDRGFDAIDWLPLETP